MFLIMMDIAECYEVVGRVISLFYMMLYMVELKHFSRVVWGKHGSVPATLSAFESISLKHRNPNRIGDSSIVFVRLSILFQHIHPNCEI